MHRLLGDDFSFIATGVMGAERKKLGYSEGEVPGYVFSIYENEEMEKTALKWMNEADVVIAGAAPEKFLSERICSGKLMFRYSERPFKTEPSVLRKWYHKFRFQTREHGNNRVDALCASAYAPDDFAAMGVYKNKMYRWGYFPAVKEYDTEMIWTKKKPTSLLWCGRFLDWKHPDDAVKLAYRLKKGGYHFVLDIIGTGEMEKELHQLAVDLHLSDRVHFLGSMPPEQVRLHMETAGIYLQTSDRKEGWGAVLNESMNSCCAVVASNEIGSVPFLIENGKNGYHYSSGNLDELFETVKCLLENPEEQKRAGRAAYRTIPEVWNARVAAERLLCLSEKILSGETHPDLFKSGPCSLI